MHQSLNSPQSLPSVNDPIQQLISLLTERLAHPWQICEMAEAVGVERRQLERLFRAEKDHSPGEYLRLLRMETAADLLCTKDDEIVQIARQVGYSDVRYFRRSFKAWSKKTPSEYRAQQTKAKAASA